MPPLQSGHGTAFVTGSLDSWARSARPKGNAWGAHTLNGVARNTVAVMDTQELGR